MNTEAEKIRLAFLDVLRFEDSSIRGGLLITDLETKPYEFRATASIKPTNFQRILYGVTLKEHVYAEMICVPLIESSKEKLDLVCIRSNNLLRMRTAVTIPVVLVEPNDGSNSQQGSRPYFLRTHDDFPDEVAWARSLLDDVTKRNDPFEPFKRLELAIQEVHRMRPEEQA